MLAFKDRPRSGAVCLCAPAEIWILANSAAKLAANEIGSGHRKLLIVDSLRPGAKNAVYGWSLSRRASRHRTNWFTSLRDARRKIEALRQDYNEQRPHSSLHYLPPTEFAQTRVAVAKRPHQRAAAAALAGVESKAVAMHSNRIQKAGHGLNGSVRWKFSIMYCGCPLLAG
jgi:hypothetical protein